MVPDAVEIQGGNANVTVSNPGLSAVRGARAVATTLASRCLQQVLNAATGVVTARALMPAGRGQLAAVILWSLFLAGLTTLGIPSALIYHLKNKDSARASLISAALSLSLMASCLTMVVSNHYLPSWLHQYPVWVITSARWFLLLTPICAITMVGRAVLESEGAFTRSNFQQLITPASTLLALLGLLLGHRLNVISASLAYTIPAIPTFAILIVQLRKVAPRLILPTMSSYRILLSYGIRSWGIDLLGALSAQMDQVLVIRFLAPAEMGAYAVMLSLSRMVGIIQSSAVTVLFPKTAGLLPARVVEITARATRVSSWLTLGCSALIACVGPQLLRVLYGRAYIGNLLTFQVLLLEATIGGAAYLMSQAFMALGRPGLVTSLQALGLASSIPVMLLLIPRYGTLGAAVALLLSTCVRFACVYGAFPVFLKVPSPSLLPSRQDAREFAAVIHERFGQGRSTS